MGHQESSGTMGLLVDVTDAVAIVNVTGLSEFDLHGMVTIANDVVGVPQASKRVAPVSVAPTARYLDLMVEGAGEVGMAASAAAAIAAVACKPRKAPAELLCI